MSDIEKNSTQIVTLQDAGAEYSIYVPDMETDYIQGGIAKLRQPYEIHMLRDMASRLGPADLVLDVGANIGNHTLYLAAVSGCKVMAFEPNAHLAQAIETSIQANAFEGRVKVLNVGVGAAAGRARFLSEMKSNLGAQSLVQGDGEIEVVRLDDLGFEQPVTAIKLDVEGMELDVLTGAQALLQTNKPDLYVECIAEGHFRIILRHLEKQGYLHWDVFNPTATHLFIHADNLSESQRLNHQSARLAINAYRYEIKLREIRERLSNANEKHKQVGQQYAVLKENQKGHLDSLRRSDEGRLLAQKEVEDLKGRVLAAEQRLDQSLGLMDAMTREHAKSHDDLMAQVSRLHDEKDAALLESRLAHEKLLALAIKYGVPPGDNSDS